MKKAVLINLLVITSVVAIFVFTGMWYMRPGVPSEVLEQARQRQLQPLLEISEPIKQPIKEEVAPVEQVVDQAALAEQLLPTLRDELSVSLEQQLYEKLKGRFSSDQEIIAQLSDALEPALTSRIVPSDYVDTKQLTASLASLQNSLQKDFDKKVSNLKTELLWEQGKSTLALNQDLDLYKQELNEQMQAYVPQLVDQMLATAVQRVYDDLSLNEKANVSELKQSFPENLSEEQILAIYTAYKSQMVLDLVPSLLDSLQEPVSKMVAALIEDLSFTASPVPALVEPSIPAVPAVKPVVVKAEPALEAPIPPVPFVEESVVVKTEPVVAVPVPAVPAVKTEPLVDEPVVQKEGQPIITLPVFAEDEPVVLVEPEVYLEQREVLRNQAIEEILKRINAVQ